MMDIKQVKAKREKQNKGIKNSVIKRSFLFSSLSFSIFGGEIHAWKQRFKNRKKKKERIALSSTCTQLRILRYS
jgi:hypothetical protein